jgi:hypothetical protein
MSRKKTGKKISKIISIVIAGFVIILIGLIVGTKLFFGNVASFAVKNTVPKFTGCLASLGGASFKILSGELQINDLILANPEGYHTDSAFKIGTLRIKINLMSLLSDTVEIEDILVNRMQITYEAALTSNIGKIKENIHNATKKEKSETTSPDAEKPTKNAKHIYIKEIKVLNGEVRMSLKGIGGLAMPVPLPNIVLRDIGKKEEGVSFAETLDVFVSELLFSVRNIKPGVGSLFK